MRSFGRLGIALTFVLVLACPVFAQNMGSLRGTVTDATGAVVPGASVTLTNEATKFTRTVVTDGKGGYFFASVEPSTYMLTVEIAGFKTREIKGLRISPNDTRGQDVTLEIGAQSERVTVRAQREMIQTETGAREGLISAEQIDNLSIIGRSPLELLRILPGAVTPDLQTLESVGNLTGTANTQAYTVNGIRSSNNVVTLDGSGLIDIGSNNGVIVVPNNDFVSEVKIQTSNYAAEYGSAGIQINAVTKGGGSEFHGVLYDYVRHHKFQANDRSNSIAGVDRPKSKFHFPGGSFSGPILVPGTGFNRNRDKAFFFFGLEVQRQQVDRGSTFSVVPTEEQRRGLFGNLGGGQNLNQPTQVLIPRGFPGEGSPAPNGNLSPYIDPTGRALINLYPSPNYRDPNNRYNYVFSALEPQNRLQMILRVDYNISDSTKAYVRLARDGEDLDKEKGVWWDSSSYSLPSPVVHHNLGRSAAANVTSVLSPTITNELLFTYSKLKLDIFHRDPDRVSLAGVGIPNYQGFFARQSDVAPVNLIAWGAQVGDLWDPLGRDLLFAYNSTLKVSDTFTKVLNTHAIKVGVSVDRVHKDQNFQNDEHTQLAFGPGWIPGSTGSTFGDLLVGRPAQVQQGTLAKIGNFERWDFDAFLQDSWKIKKNFTFEYGARLSKMTNNIERNGLGGVFIPSLYDRSKGTFVDAAKKYMNGVAYASLGQVDKDLINSRPLFVMPRLNFAWDVKGRGNWVIRGGAGVFYNRPMGNAEYDVIRIPPNGYYVATDAWAAADLGGGQGLTYNTLRLIDPLNLLGRQGFVASVDPGSVDYPRFLTTSLSIARRIPWQQTIEVGYVGTFGRHLLNRRDVNVIPEGTFSKGTVGNADLSVPVNRVGLTTDVVNSFRPFPALGDIEYWQYNGTSNYHSLQVTLGRQSSGSFQYFATYTFSKVLGLWSGEYDPVDPFDERNRSYGVLPYDRTHIANLSWNWQVPDLTSKGGALGGLLNGWQLSGISSFSSGTPIRLKYEGALAQNNVATAWWGTPDRPNNSAGSVGAIAPLFTCDPRMSGSGVGDKILNIDCIGFPTFGESGPYVSPLYLRSPSRMTHDVTVFKNFKVGKGDRRVQFRAGLFNVFNQAYSTYNAGFEDIDLHLNTTCNVSVTGVPNGAGGVADGSVCDPTKGFSFTEQTRQNFGKILLMRGRRIVEFALKFYF